MGVIGEQKLTGIKNKLYKAYPVGRGYGPDYGFWNENEHCICEVDEMTGPGTFYLHRYEREGQKLSAIYFGHHRLIERLRDEEQKMISDFVPRREERGYIEFLVANASNQGVCALGETINREPGAE